MGEKLKKLLIEEYGSLNYIDDENNSLYHLTIKSGYTYNDKIATLNMLLDNNIDPNYKDNSGNTFIHSMIQKNFDIMSIIVIMDKAIKHGFNINSKNNHGHTILHEAILLLENEDTSKLIYILLKVNFDFNVTTNNGKTFDKFIDNQTRLSNDDKNKLKKLIHANKVNDKKKNNNILDISKYGTILNNKIYSSNPAIGREHEINNIIISLATEKKLPLLVGPSGVGKTAIVDGLAYRIINNDIPNFLKDKTIIEVHMSNILAGTKYRGDFEENMQEIINLAIKNNAILFIDEFHMVFGAGATDKDKSDAASILKTYIDRYNLKVIAATTQIEYDEYMVNDALKRRFDIIKVNELDNNKLALIILNTIDVLSQKRNIEINKYIKDNIDMIISILLELTSNKNRKYDDKVYNPDLIISIIDRAFAYALVEDNYEFNLKYLILAIEDNERIYPYAKEVAIKKLNNIDNYKQNYTKQKIINFNEYIK